MYKIGDIIQLAHFKGLTWKITKIKDNEHGYYIEPLQTNDYGFNLGISYFTTTGNNLSLVKRKDIKDPRPDWF